MFELRREHEEAFRAVATQNFEDRAVAHVRQSFPRQTAGMKDPDLRDRIRRESRAAAKFGFSGERQIMRFVDAGFLMGENYLEDPANSWAREILQRNASADERARELLDGAIQHSKRQYERRIHSRAGRHSD